MATEEERFAGCLLGAAIGDALGMGVAGCAREEIASLGGCRDFAPSRGAASINVPLGEIADSEVGDLLQLGQWTDDTQLLLALAESLIEEGGLFVPEAWAHKIVRWLNLGPRTPDISTVEAALQLRTGAVLWDEAADPDGASSSPAARVAPIGLFFSDPVERRRAAVLQAQVTHGRPEAQAGALAVAEAVAMAIGKGTGNREQGTEAEGAAFLGKIAEVVADESPDFGEFARCLRLAQTLLEDEVEMETAIRVLGVSDWAREAVPCALYCTASAPADFETALLQTINRTGGAVDSIAAIVGAVLGARQGMVVIPARWRAGVEDAAHIVDIAHQLYVLHRP
ncbi:MAG TPA: ADP-ribosylglycohydrolase family protein [Chthonomonadaceae bacterium]|nr:ADP-ribosylglycohydrolase family protein [Chthonomonadaceae bacterium]